MNPPDNTSLESLIRARSGRLTAPDPAWRKEILAACESAAAAEGAPASPSVSAHSGKSLLTPRRTVGWGSLAACWIASLALNLEARHLNARTAPKTPPPAEFPFPSGAPFIQSEDVALLLVHHAQPARRPPPAARPKEAPRTPPRQSFHAPPPPRPGPLV